MQSSPSYLYREQSVVLTFRVMLCSAVVTCSVVHGCVELCSTVRKKSGSLIVIHTHILLLFTLELHNNLPLK